MQYGLWELLVTQIAASPVESLASATAGTVEASVHLNAFQLLMHGWSQLGAYNAGQVMHISGNADMHRWQNAVEATIHELGLGVPEFGPGWDEVRFSPVESIVIERVQTDFQTHISQEINRRFERTELPIRFWVMDRADGTHYLGASYDHWIADSRAMRNLMQRIFVRYQSPDAPAQLPRLTLQAPPFTTLFRRHLGLWRLWASAREGIRNMRRHMFCHRMNLADPLNFTSRCLYLNLPAGLINKIYQHAKARNASVNDVFLAVLGRVLGNYTASDRYLRKRRHGRRRDRLSLGTIVDIRDAASQPMDNVFGLYLSSYVTILTQPEKTPPDRLLEIIAKATRKVKARFGSVKAFAALEVARFWWDTYGNAKWKSQMFHKHVPVVAGTSNVNMTGSWTDQPRDANSDAPYVLDYIRISPAGPLLPLVFTLTTIRDQLSLCMTYRTTAFTPQHAQELVQKFVQGLQDIAP